MKLVALRFLPVLLSALILIVGAFATTWGNFAPAPIFIFESFEPASDGVAATKRTKVPKPRAFFKLSTSDAGRVLVYLNGKQVFHADVLASAERVQVTIGDSDSGLVVGENNVRLSWLKDGVESDKSLPFVITYDQTGPVVVGEIEHTFTADAKSRIRIAFDEIIGDGKADLNVADFQVFRETTSGTFTTEQTYTEKPKVDGATVAISLAMLPQGRYELLVRSTVKNDLQIAVPKETRHRFVVPAPPAGQTVYKLLPTTNIGPNGNSVATSENYAVFVSGSALPPGTLTPIVNGAAQPVRNYPASGDRIDIKLTQQGVNVVTVQYLDSTGKSIPFETIRIELDSIGPILDRVELVEAPSSTGTTTLLLAKFQTADLDPNSLNTDNFLISRQAAAGSFVDRFPIRSTTLDGNTVRIETGTLIPGDYQLTVLASSDKVLRDRAGNRPNGGQDQLRVFSVLPTRKFGEHVEFPPFAPPKAQAIPAEGFNPGDFVETRVARLYYYRDAHRVAQIINRNIRSYNQAAVTQSERRSEESRDQANQLTDDRRKAERDAVRAAEQARKGEQELNAARSVLDEAREAQSAVRVETSNESEINRRLLAVPPDSDEAKVLSQTLEETRRRRATNTANLARFGGDSAIESLKTQVATLEQSVATLRQTELIRDEQSQGLAAKEERARAKQFRDEVSAAETDPDTYVAGNINSLDPVTQVSISVIGEGLIELRGPIKGINKIRTLINQIDTPVGQIKIGIFTVQVNGEKGEKMEKVVGDAENHVDLSRFLVNQSLNSLRRCIQSEAAMIAEQCAQDSGHYQVDRDRRYLYTFFGRDFIDELYAIDSEFLKTENTVLSLHAMDTISMNRALFILALAKNDIRERIVTRFLESAKSELPDAEFDFRRSSELKPHVTEKRLPPWNRTHLPVLNHYHKEDVIFEAVQRNALQRYHFRNFSSFFDTGFNSPDTMNPMQREFIRLAQIFKARLVAEMEHKQRVLERGLIEDRSNNEKIRFELLQPLQQEAIAIEAQIQRNRIASVTENSAALSLIQSTLQSISESVAQTEAFTNPNSEFGKLIAQLNETTMTSNGNVANANLVRLEHYYTQLLEETLNLRDAGWVTEDVRAVASYTSVELTKVLTKLRRLTEIRDKTDSGEAIDIANDILLFKMETLKSALFEESNSDGTPGGLLVKRDRIFRDWQRIDQLFCEYRSLVESPATVATVTSIYHKLKNALSTLGSSCLSTQISQLIDRSYNAFVEDRSADARLAYVRKIEKETRVDLDHRKLLNHLIDEQEEKFIELVEGTRSHIAVLDDYLKRLSIALEDDFKVQFYDPAFVRVRESARSRAVTLGEVERTTILTNNRDFAKVDPQATMEFDLPKRQIAIKEAFDAARALVEDSGALMNDPTFLSAFQMMGGSKQGQTMKSLLPTQSSVNEQRDMGYADPLQPSGVPGSALQSLVPEPSVFKLETGTGFQIRPVMQPDGDSVVYDFDYMYTTNIREPVRADEKHIGRVKRHFVHTAVQTANFEIREVSRYQVALKLARTSQGVPLLQDIPVVGAAFRPAPSDESSIQQNIIFGQTNVYPTLYDLMGLRWAQQVVDLDHGSLLEAEHVIRGRQKTMKNFVFGEASRRVDDFLDIQNKAPSSYRPDLHHPQSLPSPYHPDGFEHPSALKDPTGNDYERTDRRPPDMQDPPYERYRHRPAVPQPIQLQSYEAEVPGRSEVSPTVWHSATVPATKPTRTQPRTMQSVREPQIAPRSSPINKSLQQSTRITRPGPNNSSQQNYQKRR
jgi:hypothetical protein